MWELDFWKAGLGNVPSGCVNLPHIQSSQGTFEEVGMGAGGQEPEGRRQMRCGCQAVCLLPFAAGYL